MTAFDDLLTWRESSTSGAAIAAALGAAGGGSGGASAARDVLAAAGRFVVTGAGSSYYLAQAVAAAARAVIGRSVIAAPLSELILRPDGVLLGGAEGGGRAATGGVAAGGASGGPEPVVIISRSGSTSEAVTVVERMHAAGHPTIAVTCRADSPLAVLADVTLVSPAGDESAIVMTRSFGSMLALLLRVVATVGGDERLTADLDRLPERWDEAAAAAVVGRRLGATTWSRVVVLGGGPALGIAAEWGLKLTETSQVPTSTYEPLEFRHGPISVCEPGMLVVGLVGGAGADEEVAVVEEAARLGAATWLIARDEDEARGATGEVSLIGGGLHPSARLPLLLHPGHGLALSLALTSGCDPDAPRYLGQVVILGPE
ncbi:MAG TPA: SIS domain-containing protein [Candidatus Limnocylindrales bacterium]|jgi:glucosamine--fructose-6-phosphate aminotransferase (isomerizing)|nr:SIS domain-containing protein [Candidatus Limnocylindrales bacterium]